MPQAKSTWKAIRSVKIDIVWMLRNSQFSDEDRTAFRSYAKTLVSKMYDEHLVGLLAPDAKRSVTMNFPNADAEETFLSGAGYPPETTWGFVVKVESTPHYDDFCREVRRRVEALLKYAVPAQDAIPTDILEGNPAANMVLSLAKAP